ncbi:nonstructural protein [Peromfec virus RodF8_28]|uniref:Nonstructural protein n=1 Tax=Peromfec virus RodF8_28 TaxID=2929366 RepID=A0A976N295_9VIRU|nr:nonstructural protein [Peromfec virus RodF8_28]
MTYNLYSMRDAKTGFMTPTIEVNDDAARRAFVHAIWNSDGILHSFCEDFSLYRIGTFNSNSAVISPELVPVHVMDGAEALRAGATHGGDPDAL